MSVITAVRSIQTSVCWNSAKTGWGPYRLHRTGTHFVGTEPNVLKYHVVSDFPALRQHLYINLLQLPDKKPEQPYGLQGTNHLLPGKGKVAGKLPTRVLLKKDKVYSWCTCGYSNNQPLCDGTHNSLRVPDLKLKPVRFIPDKDMEVWLCNCKQTKNRPFCDGTHKTIVEKDKLDGLFD